MKVIYKGDMYRPKDGEVLALVVDGKQIVCRIEHAHKTREDEMFPGLCAGCPLHPGDPCGAWLMFKTGHKVIPLEEDLK